MNRKYCIFKANKACNNCGECERCDLDSSKKCNNCGKCLEMEGFDIKAIKIDEIMEEKKDAQEYELELDKLDVDNNDNCECDNHYHLGTAIDENKSIDKDAKNDLSYDDHDYDGESDIHNYTEDDGYDDVDENIELIDDIDGLRELLEDKNKLEEVAFEQYPGLIRFKKSK